MQKESQKKESVRKYRKQIENPKGWSMEKESKRKSLREFAKLKTQKDGIGKN